MLQPVEHVVRIKFVISFRKFNGCIYNTYIHTYYIFVRCLQLSSILKHCNFFTNIFIFPFIIIVLSMVNHFFSPFSVCLSVCISLSFHANQNSKAHSPTPVLLPRKGRRKANQQVLCTGYNPLVTSQYIYLFENLNDFRTKISFYLYVKFPLPFIYIKFRIYVLRNH